MSLTATIQESVWLKGLEAELKPGSIKSMKSIEATKVHCKFH